MFSKIEFFKAQISNPILIRLLVVLEKLLYSPFFPISKWQESENKIESNAISYPNEVDVCSGETKAKNLSLIWETVFVSCCSKSLWVLLTNRNGKLEEDGWPV